MRTLDLTIIALYLLAMLGIGAWYGRRQRRVDEFFVGDRRMGAWHIGLSVVATDVGGGFSIGLGGLGFAMGLAGSWLLFTGLVGAWVSAVLLIPRVKRLGDAHGWLGYPDFLEARYDGRVALVAAVVSGIGYAGFVGAQILAGAKLSSAAFGIDLPLAVGIMAVVVVVYTSLGGMQAVVMTDTIQWGVLLGGLAFVAVPCAWVEVGGWEGMRAALPASHFDLGNITLVQALTWAATIIPIWFVGMTLYQRIFATRDLRAARRAWYLAGLLEYPVMAFLGVGLGMAARVVFPDAEPELGLPLLISHTLPVGVVGIVLAAYFSAIMSTADSCLLASVGNLVHDLYQRRLAPQAAERRVLLLGRLASVVVGAASVSVALLLPRVLDAVLLAYAFMVSGLFAPTIVGLLWRRASALAALASMILGGGAAVLLTLVPSLDPFGEPILLALPLSLVVMVGLSAVSPAAPSAVTTSPSKDPT
ncbi:MAG: sodium:solute symporter family protein [Pseudomonadota bacterium]